MVGAGAIGGVVAAKLARAGHDVTALDANQEHVARLASPGLRLDELGRPSVVPVPAVADMADLRGPGATSIGPGHVAQTTRAPIILGRSGPGGEDLGERPGQLAGILDAAAPTVVVDDINGHVWAKLLLNSTFSGLGAVSGLTYGQVAAEPPGEWLAYRLWTEGYDVARATGVRPGEVAGIRPADLERGSPTEVDVINGAVVAQAAALGRTAPLNQRVVELVHECERGARRPGRDPLAAPRAALGPAAPVRHLSPEPGARHG